MTSNDEDPRDDASSVTLDAVDRALLDVLQRDVSLTNHELAARVGVSQATALRRVRRLVERGVIARRVALVEPSRIGGFQAVVEVTLDRQGAEHQAAFEARAMADGAVQQCMRVSPGPDYVLVTWTADMAAHQAMLDRLFTQDANVRNVKSFFVTRRAKFDPSVDVHALRP